MSDANMVTHIYTHTHTHEREREERERERQTDRQTDRQRQRENTSFTWNSHNTFNKIRCKPISRTTSSQNRTTINETAKRTYTVTVDIPLLSVFLLQSGTFKIMITVMLYELGELPVHLDRSL